MMNGMGVIGFADELIAGNNDMPQVKRFDHIREILLNAWVWRQDDTQ
jgi:hypothetical protein